MALIDIDAVLGELETKTLRLRGTDFELPAELPGSTVAPFLADDLGLIDLLAEVLMGSDSEDEDERDYIDLAFDALKARPTLPKGLLAAAQAAFEDLLGEQAGAFYALKPSVPAYFAIGRHLFKEYGLGLADFFGSGEPSASGGETSSTTSKPTSDSTPATSGETPEQTQGEPSESDGS